jgi:outer membrane protein assembly factor BamE (lipoprotein component of BamABCDE complex)
MKKILASALLVLSLAACDAVQRQEIAPGASRETVKSMMGEPDTIWKEADGREFWDYPRGPGGAETIRMTIGPDGIMKDQLNILTESNFSQIQVGMNKEQVRRIIGRPGGQKQFGNDRAGLTWEWKYNQSPTAQHMFTVDFDGNGVVKGKGSYDPAMTKPQ